MKSRYTSLAAVCGTFAIQVFVPAAEPPGKVLDLSSWKLTLPIDTDRAGRPDEVKQPELAAFQEPSFFHVGETGDGIVFRAPCGGATTKNSNYPRCELREMREGGDSPAAWSTDDRLVHRLTTTLAITKTPAVKPHVVCAQIHGGSDDLLMIRLERSKLFIERERQNDVVLDSNYVLGRRFDLIIDAGQGQVQVRHNGNLRLTWNVSHEGCYFKVGCYTQSNPEKGDSPDAAGEVLVTRLNLERSR